MGKKSIEALVGLFVVLGIVGLVFLSLKAANLTSFSGGDKYTLQARFDNIGGLKVRAPVRSAGVTIGRVASIAFDPQTYQGVVKLEVDRKLEFPRDTSAKILTAGLLGDQYVGLEPGADDKMLHDGDFIRQTQSAVVLENLIGQIINSRAAEAGTAAAPASAASAATK